MSRHSPSADVSFVVEPEPYRIWSIKDDREKGILDPAEGVVSTLGTQTPRPLGLLAPTGERDLKLGGQHAESRKYPQASRQPAELACF